MIYIDYYPGSHGNFLEFICNKMAGVTPDILDPFHPSGAAHTRFDPLYRKFQSEHWSMSNMSIPSKKIISIRFTEHDTLPLLQISYLRAGAAAFDIDNAQINTYYKLNTKLIDHIKQDYYHTRLYGKYSTVDPLIATIGDSDSVTARVEQLLLQKYNLKALKIDVDHPNCPRHILRNFFERQGLMVPMYQLALMVYDSTCDVYEFPYINFYNEDAFIDQLKKLAIWANLPYNNYDSMREYHRQFMIRQPYTNSKQKCDQIIKNIINNSGSVPDVALLLEEAYINRELNKQGHERRYRY